MFIKILTLIKKISLLYQKLYRPYRLQIFVLMVLGFLSALAETLGISVLIPVFSFLTRNEVSGDRLSKAINWFFSLFNSRPDLITLLIFIGVLFIIKGFSSLLFDYIKIKTASGYELSTRTALYNETLKAKWPFLSKQKIGHLELLLVARVGASMKLLQEILLLILILSNFLIYLVVALNINFFVTMIFVVLGGAILIAFKPLVVKIKTYASNIVSLGKNITHQIDENVIGLKSIKAISIEKEIAQTGEGLFRKFRNLKIKKQITKSFYVRATEPILVILVCGAFAFFYFKSTFNFATFIVIMYLIQRIFSEITEIGKWLQRTSELIPEVTDLVSFKDKLEDSLETYEGKEAFTFNRSLEFKSVYFSYDAKRDVLTDFNLQVKRGEMIGLIGRSGVGKTTIVDLLLRLFEPRKGKISIDGKEITDFGLKEWRQSIGYVAQDIFLKNDTIENNIKFYNDNISQTKIVEASKTANIYDFIKTLPDGFKTLVGERGVRLSGGERQRVVLARILARNPKILILDEATSALDNESEKLIQEAIDRLKGETTIIVIAHRLSTIMKTDRLVVLEEGKIKETGSPKELLKDKGSYFYKSYNISKI